MEAIKRMNTDLGIGARKITVSTVGVVPNIRKLMEEDLQVRLAVSLHCSSDEERSQLLPANKRYGGLDELMNTIREYIDTTNRRVTLEWALIWLFSRNYIEISLYNALRDVHRNNSTCQKLKK